MTSVAAMPNESTAIVNLLDGLSRKAIPDDPDDDLLFAGSRKAPPAPAVRPPGMFTPPVAPAAPTDPSPFAAAPRIAHGTTPPAHGVPALRPSEPTAPFASPPSPSPSLPRAEHMMPMYLEPLGSPPGPRNDAYQATYRVSRSSRWVVANKRAYALPAGLGAVALVLAGVLLARGGGEQTAPSAALASSPSASPSTTLPAPASAPAAAEPVNAPAPVVPASQFTARTEPTVPTVTATPVVTASPIEATPTAAVTAPVETRVETPVVASKASRPKATATSKATRERHASKRRAMKPARVASVEPSATREPVRTDLDGKGALALTTASPREVWVDGRSTHRSTPLRVLLKPGKHTITLLDPDRGTAKSFEIEIEPNTTLKLSK